MEQDIKLILEEVRSLRVEQKTDITAVQCDIKDLRKEIREDKQRQHDYCQKQTEKIDARIDILETFKDRAIGIIFTISAVGSVLGNFIATRLGFK